MNDEDRQLNNEELYIQFYYSPQRGEFMDKSSQLVKIKGLSRKFKITSKIKKEYDFYFYYSTWETPL